MQCIFYKLLACLLIPCICLSMEQLTDQRKMFFINLLCYNRVCDVPREEKREILSGLYALFQEKNNVLLEDLKNDGYKGKKFLIDLLNNENRSIASKISLSENHCDFNRWLVPACKAVNYGMCTLLMGYALHLYCTYDHVNICYYLGGCFSVGCMVEKVHDAYDQWHAIIKENKKRAQYYLNREIIGSLEKI